MDIQTSSLSGWRKLHRDAVDFGPFNHKPHPIRKTKYENKTIYYCIKCRDSFVKFEVNKIKVKVRQFKQRPKPAPRTEEQKMEARLDTLWANCIKLRAGHVSEYSGLGNAQFHILDAHHILGKSTMALRYALENGVCVTRTEHQTLAHGPAQAQLQFKEWAIELRRPDPTQIEGRFPFGNTELDAVLAYLKECYRVLKGGKVCEEKEEIYFP